LPYFNIENDNNSPIKRSDFITKSKAALSYYKENITGNNSVNAMYYIMDQFNGKLCPNDPANDGRWPQIVRLIQWDAGESFLKATSTHEKAKEIGQLGIW